MSPFRNFPQLDVPVAIIIFKHAKCSQKSMEAIRRVKPRKLYIIADGPNEGNAEEAARCAETRRVVEKLIDWPCEVKKNYSETNLGCGGRIPSGLNWVFGQEESAIIVEGDIVASPSFFHFCAAMLDRYRNDENIMQIGAYNRFNHDPGDGSYFFSRYCDMWGWASWRRAWKKFGELDQTEWERIKRKNLLLPRCACAKEAELRTHVLDQIFADKLSAWGMRWQVAIATNRGQGVIPSRNLVKNIGFGLDASHTINPFTRHQLVRVHSLPPPYVAPTTDVCNAAYEARYHAAMFLPVRFEKTRSALLKLLKGK